MEFNYDEDLSENLFFLALKENEQLFKQTLEEGWIACIPKKGSFLPDKLDAESLKQHIVNGQNFSTLNGFELTVENRVVKTQECVARILFEETIYITNEKSKLKVWCLSKPLIANISLNEEATKISLLDSLDSCIEFLKEREVCLETIDSITEQWWTANELQDVDMEVLKATVGYLHNECLTKINKEEALLEFCIETYIQHLIYDRIFPIISRCVSSSDINLNLLISTLSNIQLNDLNLPLDWKGAINKCINEVAKICKFKTLLEKLLCIKRMFQMIPSSTSDLLISVLVYVLISSHISNWIANLTYMREFRYVSMDETDEYSYYITSLLAAIKYIESGNLHRELHDLIRTGNIEAVKEFISNKLNTDNLCHPLCVCEKCKKILEEPRDVGGLTALHIACLYGQMEIAELLISSGTNVNVQDCNGFAPLQFAASRGHQETILYLINCDADVNIRNNDNQTALYLACKYGHENCVKALLYSSPDIHVNCVTNIGDTPLKCASARGYSGIVRVLIEHGAFSHNKESKRKVNALFRAIENGDQPLTRFYLESEVTVNTVNVEGLTGLHVAARNGQLDIARMLLDMGASPNIHGGSNHWTPLHEAVDMGHRSVVCELIRCNGFLVDFQDANGNTPLHVACAKQDTQIALVLLNSGADSRCLNKRNESPADVAARLGLVKIVRWINST